MSWRRAAAVVAIALALAAGCVVAGRWQWGRHQDRAADVALVAANYDAAPVPLAEVLAGPDAALPAADAWRPVTVEGRYVGAAWLRNRPVAGTPALHALAVLEVAGGPLDGAHLVLDRGWVPAAELAEAVPAAPAGPRGTVTVVARLRPAEPVSDRGAPAGQVQRLAPRQVLAATGVQGDALATYGVVAAEDDAPPVEVRPFPRPEEDLGPHLSYAFQWWVFAAGALVGAVVLLRRDARAAQDVTSVGPPPARRRRAPTAEEEEDALVDAAERRALSPPS